MKISVLVAQYFYQHRVLNLPGIGSFYLDDTVDVQSIADKNSRDIIDHIHFAQKTIARPDDELIDFIRKHTGKIRPLAESDLETFVADGKLMLNIGKPFHIEGIGTLQKNKEGIYEFTPGQPVVQRLEAPPALAPLERGDIEKPKKKSVFDENPYETHNTSTRRVAIIIGLVVGLGVILWGGYSLFSSKVDKSATTAAASDSGNGEDSTHANQYLHDIDTPQKALEKVMQKADSTRLKDSTATAQAATATAPATTTPAAPATSTAPVATGPSKMYKFVLETTPYKSTALHRYNNLKPKVVLETNTDSSFFKIVLSLPGTPADTTRIKDSLHFWYWGTRNRPVTIEP